MKRFRLLLVVSLLVIVVMGIGCFLQAALAAMSMTEYPVPTSGSSPYGIAAGPDGNLWFTEGNSNKIGKITTSGVVTEYTVPTSNSGPYGIAAGPDGNLWFTEYNGNKIGKITTSGAITEYPVLTLKSQPFCIAAGPDGNLWFTEYNGNKIAKITTSGTITNEYTVPTSGSNPEGIAAGPSSDGALWFTEFSSNKIGRITTSGAITNEYTVPTSTSGPLYITAGPDGNLWFTEYFHSGKIAKITTSGAITEYTVPTSYSSPCGITSGPDGALWFTENDGNNIGRITTSGNITEYTVPTSNSYPEGIAAGPDGALWFTENFASKIGRFFGDHSAPTISSIAPNSGVQGNNVIVTNLAGTGFFGTPSVKLVKAWGDPTTQTQISATNVQVASGGTQITCSFAIPSNADVGLWDLCVTNPDDQSATSAGAFTVNQAPPTITSLSASSAAAGHQITITGTHFGLDPLTYGTSYVRFGSFVPADSDYVSWTDTSIKVKVPSDANGVAPVTVTTTAGTSSASAFNVMPEVTSLSSPSGATGVPITITGTGFGSDPGTHTTSYVRFGSFAPEDSDYVSWGNTSIEVKVPAEACGVAPITVTTPGGTSNSSAFNVLPNITNISAASGTTGTTIFITGTAFDAAPGSVQFGSTACAPGDITSWSNTVILAKIPAEACGAAPLTVTTTGGTSNSVAFNVVPQMNSISPTSGVVGSTVIVSGSGFGASRGSSYVKFGSTKVSTYTSWGITNIVVKVPAGISRTCSVVVCTSGGSSNAKTFKVKPTVTSISPTSGKVGSKLTIAGNAFGSKIYSGSYVKFGSKKVSKYYSWSNTKIVVKVPSGISGKVYVKVTTTGGTSSGKYFKVKK